MSRSFSSPRRGLGAVVAGAVGLLLAALAALSLAPRAEAAFTIPECSGGPTLGRGASFAQAAHTAWGVPFKTLFCPSGPTITYQAEGSGKGIDGMKLRGPNDPRFGGTDDPLTTEQKNQIQAGTAATGDEGLLHQVPIAVGAVAPLVNFPDGCDATALDPESRVGSGDTTRVIFTKAEYEEVWAQGSDDVGLLNWSDVFEELNEAPNDPDCDKPIIRVVRQDKSGTTFAFKDFLNRIEPERGWLSTYQTGTNGNVEWPGAVVAAPNSPNDQGCNVNSAVPGKEPDNVDHLTSSCSSGATNLTKKLLAVDGSIGYADVASARAEGLAITPNATPDDNDVYWTQLENGSGDFEEPTADPSGWQTGGPRGANCAETEFTGLGTTTLGDWSKASGVDSEVGYGICTLTYAMLFDDNADAYGLNPVEEARARTVKDYYTYIVTDGQNVLAGNDYISLPKPIRDISQAGVASIDWNKGEGGSETPGDNNPGGNPGGNQRPATPPPVVAPPSNSFSVTKRAISSKNGKATISLKLPGPGKVVMVAKAKNGKKTINVGRVTLTAGKAGTFQLTLNPSGAAKQALKKKGSLKVNLEITFTPDGGSARASKSAVTLKLAKPRK